MKYAKIVTLGIMAILIFSSFNQTSKQIEDGFIEVYFTNQLTISDLAQIQANLKEKEIYLNYDYLKFGSDGKLKGIEYDVKTGKVGGGDQTDDTSIEIGFIINTSKNPKYSIIVGRKDYVQKKRLSLENQ